MDEQRNTVTYEMAKEERLRRAELEIGHDMIRYVHERMVDQGRRERLIVKAIKSLYIGSHSGRLGGRLGV